MEKWKLKTSKAGDKYLTLLAVDLTSRYLHCDPAAFFIMKQKNRLPSFLRRTSTRLRNFLHSYIFSGIHSQLVNSKKYIK